MSAIDFIKSESELEELASAMHQEIKGSPDIVLRAVINYQESVNFDSGKELVRSTINTNVNKEDMTNKTFSSAMVNGITKKNYKEISVTRDLNEYRFNFHRSGGELPKDSKRFYTSIPANWNLFDDELKQFTKDHQGVILTRTLSVLQNIIVNSNGGAFIQSIPCFQIAYHEGHVPIPVSRDITCALSPDSDLKNFTNLIKYIADPTPDKKISNSKSFSEAFDNIYKISTLRYGSLEESGIGSRGLHDIVVLTGVPAHEIFGHHFEIPLKHIDFGESGTFNINQDINNREIILSDNPRQDIGGFYPFGFTNFDAYGRERIKRIHIQNGKTVEFLGSEYSDPTGLKDFMDLQKNTFHGHAVQFSQGHFPQARMSCTVLDGKSEKVDLEGKIVLVSHGGHTRSDEKTYQINSKETYVIKNGIPMRIIPIQVTGGIHQALSNITLLDGVSYQTGYCGKAEPLYEHISTDAPVSQFAKNQLWKQQQVYPLPIKEHHLKIL